MRDLLIAACGADIKLARTDATLVDVRSLAHEVPSALRGRTIAAHWGDAHRIPSS
ncbi:hypothetical protein [Xanthomonas arboricola]|uniref:hypothetical protein n=1 Tax=Xanthomonas arboricola TaxID=56448 RepID=UPI0015E33CD6|nr:hypothetical protein [Xanthomonas arboricola]